MKKNSKKISKVDFNNEGQSLRPVDTIPVLTFSYLRQLIEDNPKADTVLLTQEQYSQLNELLYSPNPMERPLCVFGVPITIIDRKNAPRPNINPQLDSK